MRGSKRIRPTLISSCCDNINSEELCLPIKDTKRRRKCEKEYINDTLEFHLSNQQIISCSWSSQPELTEKMREILIDWLVGIHSNLKLGQPSLFLAVSIIDNFVGKMFIRRKDLQLIGICALFIASKYEDYASPSLKECAALSANSFTAHQIRSMEELIISKLQCSLFRPTIWTFLTIYLDLIQLPERPNRLAHIASYLCELILQHQQHNDFLPSLVAAAALYTSLKIEKDFSSNRSIQMLFTITGYSMEQLSECSVSLLSNVNKISLTKKNRPLTAIKSKYENVEERS